MKADEFGRLPSVCPDPSAVQALRDVQALLEKMQQAQSKLRKQIAFLEIVYMLGVFVVALHLLFNHATNWLFAGLLFGYGLLLLIGLRLLEGASQRRFEVARRLAEHRDLNAVGPLVDGLAYVGSQKDAAMDGLIRLLPYMQSSDADLLNEYQRRVLCRVLAGRSRDPKGMELKIAILHVFAQIGYTQALPIVERLASRDAVEPVRAAAGECLQVLQTIQAQEHANETLLRAADSTGAAAETLLRSVHKRQETDPQQLLRATIRNEEV